MTNQFAVCFFDSETDMFYPAAMCETLEEAKGIEKKMKRLFDDYATSEIDVLEVDDERLGMNYAEQCEIVMGSHVYARTHFPDMILEPSTGTTTFSSGEKVLQTFFDSSGFGGYWLVNKSFTVAEYWGVGRTVQLN